MVQASRRLEEKFGLIDWLYFGITALMDGQAEAFIFKSCGIYSRMSVYELPRL